MHGSKRVNSWMSFRLGPHPCPSTWDAVYRAMLSRLTTFLVAVGSCLAQDSSRMDQLVHTYVANRFYIMWRATSYA